MLSCSKTITKAALSLSVMIVPSTADAFAKLAASVKKVVEPEARELLKDYVINSPPDALSTDELSRIVSKIEPNLNERARFVREINKDLVASGRDKLSEEHGQVFLKRYDPDAFEFDFLPDMDLTLHQEMTLLGQESRLYDPDMFHFALKDVMNKADLTEEQTEMLASYIPNKLTGDNLVSMFKYNSVKSEQLNGLFLANEGQLKDVVNDKILGELLKTENIGPDDLGVILNHVHLEDSVRINIIKEVCAKGGPRGTMMDKELGQMLFKEYDPELKHIWNKWAEGYDTHHDILGDGGANILEDLPVSDVESELIGWEKFCSGTGDDYLFGIGIPALVIFIVVLAWALIYFQDKKCGGF